MDGNKEIAPHPAWGLSPYYSLRSSSTIFIIHHNNTKILTKCYNLRSCVKFPRGDDSSGLSAADDLPQIISPSYNPTVYQQITTTVA
jgi:hypothetical protein